MKKYLKNKSWSSANPYYLSRNKKYIYSFNLSLMISRNCRTYEDLTLFCNILKIQPYWINTKIN